MPKRTRRVLVLALALSVSLGSTTPASAGMPTDRVRGFFEDVNRIIADPAYDDRLADRIAALRALLADMVDFRSAAAAALGSEWAARAPQERDEFVRLFTDLLQTSVVGSVGARARLDGNGVLVTYIGELADGPRVTVATSVLTRSGEPMGVGYRMSQRSGRWLVYDVVVDGVSLVENYRAQFHKVMQRSSYNVLVSEMRTRIVELGRIPGSATAASATAVPVVRPAASTDGVREPAAPIPAAPAPVVVSAAPPAERLIPEPRPLEAPPRMEARLMEPRVATARPPAVVAPSVTPRASAPAYWVQVGAFRNTDIAMRVVNEFRDEPVSLVTEPGRPPMLRVLVGPFNDRGAAAAKLREIRGRGYSAFIPDAAN